MWQGTQYLGLPADEMTLNEDVEACARRLLAPGNKTEADMAFIYSLGKHLHLETREDFMWNGHPVTLKIFSFPDADMMAPMNLRATLVSMDQIIANSGYAFDATVEVLREALRNKARVAAVA